MIYEYGNNTIQGFAEAIITYPRGGNQIKSKNKMLASSLIWYSPSLLYPSVSTDRSRVTTALGGGTSQKCYFSQHGKWTWAWWKLPPSQTSVKSIFIFSCLHHFLWKLSAEGNGSCMAHGVWCFHHRLKMDQWNKTRKQLAEPRWTPEWDDSWLG